MPLEPCPSCGYALSIVDHHCRHCATASPAIPSRPFDAKYPAATDYHGRSTGKRCRLLDLLSLTKRCEESKSGCDWHQVIAWAVQLRVDFADCKTSLTHHGRQISESESEEGTAAGESQKHDPEERATGLSRQGGAEKEVGGRCQAAINLGSLGDSARLSWGEGGFEVFDNLGGDDVEIGKVGAVFEALSHKSVKIC